MLTRVVFPILLACSSLSVGVVGSAPTSAPVQESQCSYVKFGIKGIEGFQTQGPPPGLAVSAKAAGFSLNPHSKSFIEYACAVVFTDIDGIEYDSQKLGEAELAEKFFRKIWEDPDMFPILVSYVPREKGCEDYSLTFHDQRSLASTFKTQRGIMLPPRSLPCVPTFILASGREVPGVFLSGLRKIPKDFFPLTYKAVHVEEAMKQHEARYHAPIGLWEAVQQNVEEARPITDNQAAMVPWICGGLAMFALVAFAMSRSRQEYLDAHEDARELLVNADAENPSE